MDSNLESPPADRGDAKPAFRKPSADKANRRYRRRSPVSGSSPSDGSPVHDHGSIPKVSKEDHAVGGLERNSDRSYHGRSSDSYRHSDKQSCRSSVDVHDEYVKHGKHADVEERDYQKLSSRSGRESRGTHSGHIRSKDHSRNLEKYSRDKYEGSRYRSKDKDRESSFPQHQKYKDEDSLSEGVGWGMRHGHSEEKERERERHALDGGVQDGSNEYRRNSGGYRSERTFYNEESRGKCSDSISRRDEGKHQMEEGYKSDIKDADDENLYKEQRKKYDDKGTNRSRKYFREPSELSTDKDLIRSENQESTGKRPKLFSLEKDIHSRKDGNVSKFTTTADGRESSSSKEVQEGKMTMGKTQANDVDAVNDINAAKVAAMKAAESVNRNLVGVAPGGCMTADQKKKLLWGNKKSTAAEEGVKGEVKVEYKPSKEDGGDLAQSEKQKELQLDLEKQYTAGLRRRDGRTVGLGL